MLSFMVADQCISKRMYIDNLRNNNELPFREAHNNQVKGKHEKAKE